MLKQSFEKGSFNIIKLWKHMTFFIAWISIIVKQACIYLYSQL